MNAVTLPELVFVGYFPKQTNVPADWKGAPISEICSISECLAEGPEDWTDYWRHNELGFYNTRADAWSIVSDHKENYSLFAYRLLLIRFTKEGKEPFGVAAKGVEPLPEGWTSLGFDVATKTYSLSFKCSPISCNDMSHEVPVNRYCLLETLDEAIGFAERCANELPVEPGPYYVLEVLRAAG